MRTALTIAGSDSGAGAGIQADLKTFAAHGVYGTCAITAVTAQNTRRVSMVAALSPEMVTAQIDAIATDIGVDAAKTGMLANGAIVRAVAAAVRARALRLLVVDPVMIAKSGDALLEHDAIDALTSELLPLAHVVTPNIPEAEALAGLRIETAEQCREAARRIAALGPAHVVIKGGHASTQDITDVLFDGRDFEAFRGERVPGRHTHGTGCTFSAALTAHLALGRNLREAIPLAQAYVAGAIRAGIALGAGHGPMDHFWQR
jgi:hydroxymethylpyrimidine/phosphomethylpyrimidine kinase